MGVDHAQAVGADQRNAGRLDLLANLVFQRRAFGSDFLETGRNHHQAADLLGDRFIDHAQSRCRRDDQHAEVHRARHVAERGIGVHAHHVAGLGIDGIDGAIETAVTASCGKYHCLRCPAASTRQPRRSTWGIRCHRAWNNSYHWTFGKLLWVAMMGTAALLIAMVAQEENGAKELLSRKGKAITRGNCSSNLCGKSSRLLSNHDEIVTVKHSSEYMYYLIRVSSILGPFSPVWPFCPAFLPFCPGLFVAGRTAPTPSFRKGQERPVKKFLLGGLPVYGLRKFGGRMTSFLRLQDFGPAPAATSLNLAVP